MEVQFKLKKMHINVISSSALTNEISTSWNSAMENSHSKFNLGIKEKQPEHLLCINVDFNPPMRAGTSNVAIFDQQWSPILFL